MTLPPEGTPVIVVSSGGFHGSASTRIYAGDVLVSDVYSPGGRTPKTIIAAGREDVFADAVALLEANGPAAKAAVMPQTEMCLDYGSDLVRASPAVTGFDQVSTGCPDPAVTLLMDQVLGLLAAPDVR